MSVSSGQEDKSYGLADQMAQFLVKANLHRVVVFDFIGPDNRLNALGQDLADKFSIALQNHAPALSVVDRAAVKKIIAENRVAPDIIRDKEIAWWLASQLQVDAVILGQLIPVGDEIKISIGSLAMKTGAGSPGFSIVSPLSTEMNSLIESPVMPVRHIDTAQLMAAKGTVALCVHCPNPNFSGPAVQEHVHGTAILNVTVGLDGRAHDIEIVKPLSHRLTEQAIKAVQSWTFTPGKSADGQPLEMETRIEVYFRLGR